MHRRFRAQADAVTAKGNSKLPHGQVKTLYPKPKRSCLAQPCFARAARLLTTVRTTLGATGASKIVFFAH